MENKKVVILGGGTGSSRVLMSLKDLPLVDYYEAYQILDNNWTQVASDLEIIQTEGFAATKMMEAAQEY